MNMKNRQLEQLVEMEEASHLRPDESPLRSQSESPFVLRSRKNEAAQQQQFDFYNKDLMGSDAVYAEDQQPMDAGDAQATGSTHVRNASLTVKAGEDSNRPEDPTVTGDHLQMDNFASHQNVTFDMQQRLASPKEQLAETDGVDAPQPSYEQYQLSRYDNTARQQQLNEDMSKIQSHTQQMLKQQRSTQRAQSAHASRRPPTASGANNSAERSSRPSRPATAAGRQLQLFPTQKMIQAKQKQNRHLNRFDAHKAERQAGGGPNPRTATQGRTHAGTPLENPKGASHSSATGLERSLKMLEAQLNLQMFKRSNISVRYAGKPVKLGGGEERMLINSLVRNSPITISALTRQTILDNNGYGDQLQVEGRNHPVGFDFSFKYAKRQQKQPKQQGHPRRGFSGKRPDKLGPQEDQERMRILLSHQSTQYPKALGVWGRTHDILPGGHNQDDESEAIFMKQRDAGRGGKLDGQSFTGSPYNSMTQMEGIGEIPPHISRPSPPGANVNAKGPASRPPAYFGNLNDQHVKNYQPGRRQGAGMKTTKLKDQLNDPKKPGNHTLKLNKENNGRNRQEDQFLDRPTGLDPQPYLQEGGSGSREKQPAHGFANLSKRTVLQTFRSQDRSLQKGHDPREKRPSTGSGMAEVRVAKALNASRGSLQHSQNSKKSRAGKSMDNLDLINELCQKSLLLSKEKGRTPRAAGLDLSFRDQEIAEAEAVASGTGVEAVNTLMARAKVAEDDEGMGDYGIKESKEMQRRYEEARQLLEVNKGKPTNASARRRSTEQTSTVTRIGDPHLNIVSIGKDQRPLSGKPGRVSKGLKHIEIDTNLVEDGKGSTVLINSTTYNSKVGTQKRQSGDSRNKAQVDDRNQLQSQKQSATSQSDGNKRVIFMRANHSAKNGDQNDIPASQFEYENIVQERIKDIENESQVIYGIRTQDITPSMRQNPPVEQTQNAAVMDNQDIEIMTKLPAPQQGLLYQQGRCSYRMIKPWQDTKTRNIPAYTSNLSSQKFMVKQLKGDRDMPTGKVRPSSAYVYGATKKAPNPAFIGQQRNEQNTSATCGSLTNLMRQSQDLLLQYTHEAGQLGFTDLFKAGSTSQTSFTKSPISGIQNQHIVSSKNLLMKSKLGTQTQQFEIESGSRNILVQNADQFPNRRQAAEQLSRRLGDGSKHFKSQVRIASAMLGQRNGNQPLSAKAAGTDDYAQTLKLQQYSEACSFQMAQADSDVKQTQQRLLRNIEIFNDRLNEQIKSTESADSVKGYSKGQLNWHIDRILEAQQDKISENRQFLNELKHADASSSKGALQRQARQINRNSSKSLRQPQGVKIAQARPGRLHDNSKLLENLSQSSMNSSVERTRQKFQALSKNHSKNALADLVEMSKHEESLPPAPAGKAAVKAAAYGRRLRGKIGAHKVRNQKKMAVMSQKVKSASFQNLLGAAAQDPRGVKGVQALHFDYLQRLFKSYEDTKQALSTIPAPTEGDEIPIDRVGSYADLVQLESLISQKLLETRGEVLQMDKAHHSFIISKLQGLRKKVLKFESPQPSGKNVDERKNYFKQHITEDIDNIIKEVHQGGPSKTELPKYKTKKEDHVQQFMPQSRIRQSQSRQSKSNLKGSSKQSLQKASHQQNTVPRGSMLSSASGISYGKSERQQRLVN